MSPRTITCRDLRFYQIHNVIVRAKKAYLSLRGKHILQLLMKFVWHPNYTTHSFPLQENSEKMLRKSLFCRKTHGGMQSRPARIRRAKRLLAALILADCRANGPPPPRKPAGLPREEGAGRGRGALTAPQPYRLRGRQRIKAGKGVFAFPVWSAIFRLPFASSGCRPYGGRGAGRRSFRHQEEFVDHPLGAIALLGLPQTL